MEIKSGVTLPDRAILDLELGSGEVLERMEVPVIVTRLAPGEDRPRVCFVNDAAVGLLGYAREELLEREAGFWEAGTDVAGPEAIGEALRSGRTVAIETAVRRKDGTERAVRVQMAPHQGAWGLWVINTALPVSDEPRAVGPSPQEPGPGPRQAERSESRQLEGPGPGQTERSDDRHPEEPENRHPEGPGPRQPDGLEKLSVGDLVLDPGSRWVWYGLRRVDLTESECVVLRCLMERPETVVERNALYQELWGFDPSVRSRAVDVYVGSLRRKLRDLGAPDIIRTARGVGYFLRY